MPCRHPVHHHLGECAGRFFALLQTISQLFSFGIPGPPTVLASELGDVVVRRVLIRFRFIDNENRCHPFGEGGVLREHCAYGSLITLLGDVVAEHLPGQSGRHLGYLVSPSLDREARWRFRCVFEMAAGDPGHPGGSTFKTNLPSPSRAATAYWQNRHPIFHYFHGPPWPLADRSGEAIPKEVQIGGEVTSEGTTIAPRGVWVVYLHRIGFAILEEGPLAVDREPFGRVPVDGHEEGVVPFGEELGLACYGGEHWAIALDRLSEKVDGGGEFAGREPGAQKKLASKMVGTATLVGAALGLGAQMYSNAVRKLPLMRHPWEHLLAIGLGGTFGSAVVKWEQGMAEQVEKTLAETKEANRKRFLGTMRVEH
ncbi:hypothetical protein CBR_g39209 [Chara braunii]|uniref:Uncharacterized protein n=1 Tax=Chara braunii TaxID=69332 RepID=A0A388LR91_CHABU|nr:hypothetical protein CBR_g39209 [Chara braunii]|eukprot:GBG84834.1 hypothetical protein CBR_g39209 [Chara braunii]